MLVVHKTVYEQLDEKDFFDNELDELQKELYFHCNFKYFLPIVSLIIDYCLTVYLLYNLFVKLFWPCQGHRSNRYGKSLFFVSFIKGKGFFHFLFSDQLLWKSP